MPAFDYYEKYPYTEGLQRDIVALLLQDGTLYSRFYGIWKAKYFTEYKLGHIANSYLTYRMTAKENPSRTGMVNILMMDMVDAGDDVKKSTLKYLGELYDHKIENQHIIEKYIVEWARRAAILDGVYRAAEILKNNPDGAKLIIDEAYKAGADLSDFGIQVDKEFEDAKKILIEQQTNPIPTGLQHLDPMLNGGVRPGELLVFMGSVGTFKSGTLLNCTIDALTATQGRTVAYVSLELSKAKVFERYFCHISGHDIKQFYSNPDTVTEKFYQKVQEKFSGKLFIKHYATNSMTASHLRAYLQTLEANGHKVDLLVVDYGNIMKTESKSASEHVYIGDNFISLRSIAVEFEIPVITACQTNREGVDKKAEDLNLKHVAGSMGIPQIADYVIGIVRSKEAPYEIIHSVIKNRNGQDSMYFICETNYDLYQMKHIGIPRHSVAEEEKKNNKKKDEEAGKPYDDKINDLKEEEPKAKSNPVKNFNMGKVNIGNPLKFLRENEKNRVRM